MKNTEIKLENNKRILLDLSSKDKENHDNDKYVNNNDSINNNSNKNNYSHTYHYHDFPCLYLKDPLIYFYHSPF